MCTNGLWPSLSGGRSESMRIGMAADHDGFELKEHLAD